jgi:serine/threonine protein kinase
LNLIGQVLLDQFRIEAFIASGGMGAVYRVWDLKRSVPLAMKVLHTDLAEDPSIFKRFKREARALKKLAHPNIVAFYGLYQTPYFYFLLEDYVDGPTLREVLRFRHGKALSIQDSLVYLKALCAALGYAHINGVVHCDVKPGNVMIDHGGHIYLTDFGIARHAESTLTTLGVAGSPAYMAPEQIRGEPVSPATDVYALGVLLFEMLTGQRPFRGNEEGTASFGTTAAERVRYAHLHLPPPDPRHLNLNIPEALARVILKALSKEPGARYQDVSQMLAEVIAAVNLHADEIPARIDESTPQKLQEFWLSAREVPTGEEVIAAQPIEPIRGEPTVSIPKINLGRLIAGVGAGLAILVIGGFLALAVINRNGINKPPNHVLTASLTVSALSTDEEQTPVAAIPETPTSAPTQSPIPITVLPTKTSNPATSAPIPRISTPLLPTRILQPINPQFTAGENMNCRDGPSSSYEPHTTILKGQTLPVLRRWENSSWILVGINREDTRTKCCWIGGQGSLNVERASIPTINFLPDRIRCDLNP